MNIPNKMSYEDLKQIAIDLGKEKGKGDDTQVRFGTKLVEGAFYNAIDLEPDKHGKDKDDATVLAGEYVKAQTGNSLFNAKAPNQRKLIACCRTLIKVGQWPSGGPGEPIASMNSVMTIWGNERVKPENKGLLDDAFNTLMKWARVQIRRDSVMDKTELRDLCFKKPPQQRTIEARLKAVKAELTKINDVDKSTHLSTALSEVVKRLKAIEIERNREIAAQEAARKAKATQAKQAKSASKQQPAQATAS